MIKCIMLAMVLALGLIANAKASLIGNGVFLSWGPPQHAIVGEGVEFRGINGYVTFDFGADTITVRSVANPSVGWSGWSSYVFSEFTETITGLSLESNYGFSGSVLNDFSFTPHSISLNMEHGGAIYGATMVFQIGLADSPATEISEPSSYSLILVALAGLSASRRRGMKVVKRLVRNRKWRKFNTIGNPARF